MTKTLQLELEGAALDFEVRRIVVAGYTGRDAAQVRAHIAELERQGIPAPPGVPTAYVLDASFATVASRDSEIALGAASVSGEAEPALLFRTDRLEDALVSVISDFTDRQEERRSIAHSKLQPKPLSGQVWRYKDVESVWDEIAIRSWVALGTDRPLYQSGKLSQLLRPEDLLPRLNAGAGLQGTVLLMGTVPLLAKQFSFSGFFACELETPRGARLSYECRLRRPKVESSPAGSAP